MNFTELEANALHHMLCITISSFDANRNRTSDEKNYLNFLIGIRDKFEKEYPILRNRRGCK